MLANAQSPDPNLRDPAMQQLEQQKQSNPSQFLDSLASTLSDDSLDKSARRLAGILIKNTIENLTQQEGSAELWEGVAEDQRVTIRNKVLGSLAAQDPEISRSAAQAVASIARQDLTKQRWQDIINVLVTNASNPNLTYKQASLMTLGYICEGLPQECIDSTQTNYILTAIASCITEEQPTQIVVAAIKALRNSLQFAKQNFENDKEREYLVHLILKCCAAGDQSIKTESYMTLIEVVGQYYDYIGTLLEAIANTCYKTIQEDNEEVAVLAVEVWNQVGDLELERESMVKPQKPLRGYINLASDSLMPLLLKLIVNFEYDEDEWNMHKACASMISVMAQLSKDKILQPAINFTNSSFSAESWQYRKSACMVFGSVLEGPSNLSNYISGSLPVLIKLMSDPNAYVRQSANWAISKVCELHYKIVAQPVVFQQILPPLVNSLKDEPRIACHGCWALINLVDNSADVGLFKANIFEHLVNELYYAANRADSIHTEHNLQLAAYSAISTLIEKAADDCVPLIETQIPNFIHLLKNSSAPGFENLQSALCSALQACFSRARPEQVTEETANYFVDTLILVFNNRNSVFEEGIHAIGGFATCMENRIVNYIGKIGVYLGYALQRQEAEALCKSGTMVIGDIARASGDQCSSFVKDLVAPLVANLRTENASSDIKVQSICSLADIASNSRGEFGNYMQEVLPLVFQAADASLQVAEDDIDMFDFLRDLRESVMEFFEGLIQGMEAGGQLQALQPHIKNIVTYSLTVTQDTYKPRIAIHRTVIGVIGDIAKAFSSQVKEIVKTPQVLTYLQRFRASNNMKLREITNWAFNIVNLI